MAVRFRSAAKPTGRPSNSFMASRRLDHMNSAEALSVRR
jgi:hypothetical protein